MYYFISISLKEKASNVEIKGPSFVPSLFIAEELFEDRDHQILTIPETVHHHLLLGWGRGRGGGLLDF